MINFLKKHKLVISAAVCTAAVLAGAFFAGGKLGENPTSAKASISETTAEASSAPHTGVSKTNNIQNETIVSSESKTKQTEAVKPNSAQKNTIKSEVSEKSQNSSAIKPQSSGADQKSTFPQSSNGEKDKYQTDKIPDGKPKPVEPEDQEIEDNKLKCTFSISCATILDNMDKLKPAKKHLVPSDGWILKPVTVIFNEGESVFDVLQRVCIENKIHLESSFTPMYNSAYIEGINNIYEFDCGSLSGWMYEVNEWFPNYGCSRCQVQNGDVIKWQYTCCLGYDIGGNNAVGE